MSVTLIRKVIRRTFLALPCSASMYITNIQTSMTITTIPTISHLGKLWHRDGQLLYNCLLVSFRRTEVIVPTVIVLSLRRSKTVFMFSEIHKASMNLKYAFQRAEFHIYSIYSTKWHQRRPTKLLIGLTTTILISIM